jgi:hypothetical protein
MILVGGSSRGVLVDVFASFYRKISLKIRKPVALKRTTGFLIFVGMAGFEPATSRLVVSAANKTKNENSGKQIEKLSRKI